MFKIAVASAVVEVVKPPDTRHLLTRCNNERATVGKNWARRGSNHKNAKEMEMDWSYLEEGERKHHQNDHDMELSR